MHRQKKKKRKKPKHRLHSKEVECIEIQNRIIDGSFGAIDQDYMKTINAAFATKFPLSKYFLENSEESNCNNVVTESKKRNTAPLSNGPHAHLNGYVDELKEGGHDGSKGHCAAENGSTEANQQQQKTCSPDAKTAVMVNGTVSNSNAANDDNCAMGDSQNPATINLNHSI